MSIVDGTDVDALTTNAALVSKTATSSNTVTGKIDLNNSDTESGGSITNIQKFMNQESTTFRAVQTVTASGTITIDERIKNHIVLVVGDAGNVTTSTTPFNAENGGSFLDGTVVTVIGTNDSQRVKLANQSAASNVTVQNGDVDLYLNTCITYMRVTIGGTSYWLERSRNT